MHTTTTLYIIYVYVLVHAHYTTSFNSSKKAKKKKQAAHLPVTSLIPEVEILNFYEGVTSFEEFAIIVCSHILQVISNLEDFDQTKIHLLCWDCYSEVRVLFSLLSLPISSPFLFHIKFHCSFFSSFLNLCFT